MKEKNLINRSALWSFNMRTAIIASAMAFVFAVSLPAQSSESGQGAEGGGTVKTVSLKEIASLAAKNNFSVQNAKLLEGLAIQGYNQIIASGKPKIALKSDPFSNPLYGYSYGSPPLSFSGFGVTGVAQTHKTGSALSLDQLLPTGGGFSASLSNTFNVSRIGEGDWIISQDPSLSLSVFQPLFVDGKFLNGDIMKSARRAGEIGYERAGVSIKEAANQASLEAVNAAFQIALQRKNIRQAEEAVTLSELKLSIARDDRNAGRIAESDLLAAELEKLRREDLIFDAKYQLLLSEQAFAAALGLNAGPGYDISLDVPDLRGMVYAPPAASEGKSVFDGNPSVAKGVLSIEESLRNATINRVDEAPVASVFFNIGPRYPDSRINPGTFGGAFSDFFEEGGGVDFSLGLGFSLSLYAGGREGYRRKADELSAQLARQNLERTRLALEDTASSLMARAALLDEKLKLLQSNNEYTIRLLEKEKQRQALGASTKLDVETVRLELSALELRIEQTKAEQTMLFLQLLSLAGKDLADVL